MAHRLIRYRTRPERADSNQALVQTVFAELRARQVEGLRYLVLRAPGETFLHLVTVEPGNDTARLTSLPSFQEFQREIRERCLEQPEPGEVTIVGNHRMLLLP
jgi:hypothetical protein